MPLATAVRRAGASTGHPCSAVASKRGRIVVETSNSTGVWALRCSDHHIRVINAQRALMPGKLPGKLEQVAGGTEVGMAAHVRNRHFHFRG